MCWNRSRIVRLTRGTSHGAESGGASLWEGRRVPDGRRNAIKRILSNAEKKLVEALKGSFLPPGKQAGITRLFATRLNLIAKGENS